MYSPPKNSVTLVKVEDRVKENSAGVPPSQSDDLMMEYIEGEALPMVSLEV